WKYMPQGHGIDQFLREGILITGALPDVNLSATVFQQVGRRLMTTMSDLPRMASFAALIADENRNGRVWRDVGGKPAITWNMSTRDRDLLHRGISAVGEVCFAAGAKRIYPAYLGASPVEKKDFARFRVSPPN